MSRSFRLPACPLLPEVTEPLGHMVTRAHAPAKCGRFYEATLRYAQSLWREGKPAQAILQLNKAFMAGLRGDEEVLLRHPPPYEALMWILANRPADAFIGNPVRHFQHLATRVSGERRELRSWRAWACFHLSRSVLPVDGFPLDAVQIEAENLTIPAWPEVLRELSVLGWRGEAELLAGLQCLPAKKRS